VPITRNTYTHSTGAVVDQKVTRRHSINKQDNNVKHSKKKKKKKKNVISKRERVRERKREHEMHSNDATEQRNERNKWSVKASEQSQSIKNPIREIMDNFQAKPNLEKRTISLALGDPSSYDYLKPPPGVVAHVCEIWAKQESNGYAASSGLHEARVALSVRYGPSRARKSLDHQRSAEAIADFERTKNSLRAHGQARAREEREFFCSTSSSRRRSDEEDEEDRGDEEESGSQAGMIGASNERAAATTTTTTTTRAKASGGEKVAKNSRVVVYPNTRGKLSARDCFLTHGCSQALSHAIKVLAEEGSVLLLPKPGFALYQTLCELHKVECVFYDLDAENRWEIDLLHVKKLVMENKNRIKAILVNNPSNPCGALFSERHLIDICECCEELKLPIIADEVYEDISFGDRCNYLPLASVSKTVPILAVGSLSKRWLVPGWRLGWLLVHDRNDILKNGGIHGALEKLSQVTLGPPTPLQAALPFILQNDDSVWLNETLQTLREARDVCIHKCQSCPGLSIDSLPEGAMYALVKIDCKLFCEAGIADDFAFTSALFSEESVLLLPGQCFGALGYTRVVLTCPVEILVEAWERIEQFCKRKIDIAMKKKNLSGDVLINSEFGRKTPTPAPASDEEIDDVFSLEETIRREEAIY